MRRSIVLSLTLVVSLVFVPSQAIAASDCGRGADFDGDGREDLAVGVYGKDPGGKSSAGSVHIVYGSSGGLTASGDQVLHEDVEGMADTAAPGDFFGWAIATGDFNGDGRDDLAAGIPHKQVGIAANGGSVHIVYGSAEGLTASGDQVFNENTSGMAGSAEDFESFGSSLAACDFDGDGRDDLAVGIPGETVGGQNDAGAVHIIYGSTAGLTASGDQIFNEDTPDMNDTPEEFGFLGNTMTAGDFNGDGRGDLAIGGPFKDPGGKSSAGTVHIVYGSPAGLTASGDQVFHQDASGMADVAVAFDRFGRSLSTGDFDGDGRDDLAVGIAFKVVNGKDDAGAVHVIYGSSAGLTASGDQVFHQDSTDMADVAAAGDFFGKAVSAADFNGDGRDDLAVGIPGKPVNSKADAGAMHVIYGSGAGLTTSGNQFFHEDTSGMADVASPLDEFGRALSSGDHDADGRDDLSVGVPFKNVGGKADAGHVHVMNGSTGGLSASGDLILHEDVSGMADDSAELDFFGYTLVGSPFVD